MNQHNNLIHGAFIAGQKSNDPLLYCIVDAVEWKSGVTGGSLYLSFPNGDFFKGDCLDCNVQNASNGSCQFEGLLNEDVNKPCFAVLTFVQKLPKDNSLIGCRVFKNGQEYHNLQSMIIIQYPEFKGQVILSTK